VPGNCVCGDAPFLFQLANNFIHVLRQPPLRLDRHMEILPPLRTSRQPTDDPIAQRAEVWLWLDQELLIRIGEPHFRELEPHGPMGQAY
jgi:hypothetical protein